MFSSSDSSSTGCRLKIFSVFKREAEIRQKKEEQRKLESGQKIERTQQGGSPYRAGNSPNNLFTYVVVYLP